MALPQRSEPRIILWDLETLPDLREVMKVIPNLGEYPGLTLKASINSIICFGYKIVGDKQAKCLNAWDYANWKRDVNDDSKLVKDIYDILIDADVVVTHNGKRFDWKFLQTRLMKHNLPPLPRILHIDTCAESKKNLFMFNNRLNTLAKFLTSEEKLENGGWQLWVDVVQRKPAAMKLMTQYCKQDVETLHAVFKRMLPMVNGMPNYNTFKEIEQDVCANCGSTRVQKMGFRTTKTAIFQRLRCLDCGTTMSKASESKTPKTF
jgi:DNA polymerase elongation subunit (family B)